MITVTNRRFDDTVVKKLIDWTLDDRDAREVVTSVTVEWRHNAAYSGRAWVGGRTLVRIGGPEHYPLVVKYKARAPEYTVADVVEAFVMVFAHEVEHQRQFARRHAWQNAQNVLAGRMGVAPAHVHERAQVLGAGPKPRVSEVAAEHAAYATLLRFRAARKFLGLEALATRVAEKHERLVAQREKSAALKSAKAAQAASPAARREKVLAAIKAWTTKHKRAETALKKYRRRLARLDKLIGGAS